MGIRIAGNLMMPRKYIIHQNRNWNVDFRELSGAFGMFSLHRGDCTEIYRGYCNNGQNNA